MGESGSGKSTLINMLAGLDIPDAGQIEVNGERLSELDEAARARYRLEHVSVIFQDSNLIAEMTNIENVALPLWARGKPRAQGRRAAEDALVRVGIEQLGDRRPSEVSGCSVSAWVSPVRWLGATSSVGRRTNRGAGLSQLGGAFQGLRRSGARTVNVCGGCHP